jgi:hypothetical protein
MTIEDSRKKVHSDTMEKKQEKGVKNINIKIKGNAAFKEE